MGRSPDGLRGAAAGHSLGPRRLCQPTPTKLPSRAWAAHLAGAVVLTRASLRPTADPTCARTEEEHRRTRRTLNLQIKSTSSKLNGFKQESDERSTALRANRSRNKIQKPQVTILDLEENRNPSMKNNMGKTQIRAKFVRDLKGITVKIFTRTLATKVPNKFHKI